MIAYTPSQSLFEMNQNKPQWFVASATLIQAPKILIKLRGAAVLHIDEAERHALYTPDAPQSFIDLFKSAITSGDIKLYNSSDIPASGPPRLVPEISSIAESRRDNYRIQKAEIHSRFNPSDEVFVVEDRPEMREKCASMGVNTLTIQEAVDTVSKVTLSAIFCPEAKTSENSQSGSSDEHYPISDPDKRVFLGHGHSNAWTILRTYLEDIGLDCDEFNRISTAGRSNKEVLTGMLDSAKFAFLIMTGEDLQPDNTLRARENVIHEAGLFQGRLGFEKAILLVEDGCKSFSNVDGLSVIPFDKNDISTAFEKVRKVLEREKIISPAPLTIKPEQLIGKAFKKQGTSEKIQFATLSHIQYQDGNLRVRKHAFHEIPGGFEINWGNSHLHPCVWSGTTSKLRFLESNLSSKKSHLWIEDPSALISDNTGSSDE